VVNKQEKQRQAQRVTLAMEIKFET